MTKALSTWEAFQTELEKQTDAIASQLPSTITIERFKNAAIAAVKQNPDLAICTPRSLFAAITQSAQDGLVSDGKEGIITAYNEKIKDKWGKPILDGRGKEQWQKVANWNPMVFGLRKRARELDGIIIDAQVVYEKDSFVWRQGDDPKIDHQIKMGERGKMIGVYAIFKREDGVIIHREVMDADQVMKVKSCSKQADGLLWTKFETEGWRKVVVRRGCKTVPFSDTMQSVVERDDEHYEFDAEPVKAIAPPTPPEPPMKATPIKVKKSADADSPPTPNESIPQLNNAEPFTDNTLPEKMLEELEAQLATATDIGTANEIYAEVTGQCLTDDSGTWGKAEALVDNARDRIGAQKVKWMGGNNDEGAA